MVTIVGLWLASIRHLTIGQYFPQHHTIRPPRERRERGREGERSGRGEGYETQFEI